MSDLLLRARGTLIPSSVLCCPGNQVYSGTNQRLASVTLSKECVGTDEAIESDSTFQSYKETETFPTTFTSVVSSDGQLTDDPNQPSPGSRRNQNVRNVSCDQPYSESSSDSHQNCPSPNTTESPICNLKRREEEKSRKTMNCGVQPLLTLPGHSCLNQYLHDGLAGKNLTDLPARGERGTNHLTKEEWDLYWLCNPGKTVLFACQPLGMSAIVAHLHVQKYVCVC